MADKPAESTVPAGFWYRHERLLMLTVLALAVVVTLMLLSQSDEPVVLYQAF